MKIALAQEQFGRGDYSARVKLGMSGQAHVITDSESLLVLLARRVRQAVSLD